MSHPSWRIRTLLIVLCLNVLCLTGCEFRRDTAGRDTAGRDTAGRDTASRDTASRDTASPVEADGGSEASVSANGDASRTGKSGTSVPTGPHGGLLIEIGDDRAYHAELTLDPATRDIRIYFSGASPGQAKIVSDLVLEIEHAGQLQVLSAEPWPQAGETKESPSAFVIRGNSLPPEISAVDQLRGHFHITIDGADYAPGFPPTLSGDVPPHGVDLRFRSPAADRNGEGAAAITGTNTAATRVRAVG